MFVDDPMGAAEPCWDTQLVPFTTPSDRVCLWANAAFNFLNKLQFQPFESTTGAATADATADVSDIFAHHLHKKYQCVVCREVYGASAAPAHREDCDLGLLLQQGRKWTRDLCNKLTYMQGSDRCDCGTQDNLPSEETAMSMPTPSRW